MLARVLKDNMSLSIELIRQVFNRYNTPAGYAKGIVGLLRNVMETDPEFFSIFFEGFAVARHSRVVSDELSDFYGRFRKSLENGLKTAKSKDLISPTLPVEALGAIITGLIDGMGLQLLTEPELCQNQVIWDSIESSIADLLTDTR